MTYFFAKKSTFKFAALIAATIGLQACSQSVNLADNSAIPASSQSVALKVESTTKNAVSATERQNELLKSQQDEIAKWQKVWQDQLAKLEEDRKKRLLKANPKSVEKAPVKKATPKRQAKKKGGRSRYDALIRKYAKANGVPIRLAHAVVQVESSYRANARGGVGEIGLMQLRLATARGMGYRGSAKALYNPETNIKYGMKYLGKAYKLGGGSTCGAILKYNAGHGAKRMNPTSRKYCRRVKQMI